MGAWGYHSDENDYVSDIWIRIVRSIMPESYSKLTKQIGNKSDYIHVVKFEYAKNNPKKIYTAINKWLQDENNIPCKIIIGVILRSVYNALNVEYPDPLAPGRLVTVKFPKALPDNFPQGLRNAAIKNIKLSYEEIEGEKWEDPKARKRALNAELKLFE